MENLTPTPIVDDKAPEPKAAPKVEPKAPKSYVVASRDTWGILEDKFGKDIAEKNGITNGQPLVEGQVLEVR
jgi:hypothetical protein